MRSLILLSLATLGVVSTAQAGPYRYYSTCYQPSYCTPTYANYSYTPYYQTYYQPTYTAPYVAPTPPPTPVVPTYSTDWRSEVVKYNTALKEIEAFNQAMNTIQPGYASSHSVSYGGQGATLYATPAYSVKSQFETSGLSAVDVGVILQQQSRNANQISQAGSQITSEVNATVDKVSEGQIAVAKINAQSNANALTLQQAVELVKANTVPTTRTTTTVSGTGVAQPVVQPNVSAVRAEFMKIARQDCGECHTAGPKMKGNFSVDAIATLTRPQAKLIRRKITSLKAEDVMPKPAAGQPVTHVSDDHMEAWLEMLSQVQ